jgi:large subunit ribosomal protein L4
MPNVEVKNLKNEVVEQITLPDAVFGAEVNEHALFAAVRHYLACGRGGNASTKSRGELRGGGKKPWRQKGTGRARAGSTRSPLWRGGATIHGPRPRSYSYKLPKKVRWLAIRSALSQKLAEDKITVVADFELPTFKTKGLVDILQGLGVDRKALLVDVEDNRNLDLASRNIPGVKQVRPLAVNAYDVLKHDRVILSRQAAAEIGEVYGK